MSHTLVVSSMQQFILFHIVYSYLTSQVCFPPGCLVTGKNRNNTRLCRLKYSTSILQAKARIDWCQPLYTVWELTQASAFVGSLPLPGWTVCLTLCPAPWPSALNPYIINSKSNECSTSGMKWVLWDSQPVFAVWACWTSLWPASWVPGETTGARGNL